jgi:FkbM family methyltransferase
MFLSSVKRKVVSVIGQFGYSVQRIATTDYPDQLRFFGSNDALTIFDVGANRGNTVAAYRRLFPMAVIHLFEPIPELAAGVRDRFLGDAAVFVHEAALTDSSGEAFFNVNSVVDTSSLLNSPEAATPVAYRGVMGTTKRITVATTTLDEFCRKHDIRRIDILKMDIQGGELAALRGAESLLEREAISLIFAEVFVQPFYEEQPLFGDVASFLARWEYTLHNVYNVMFRGETGRCSWMDVIFVSPALKKTSRRLVSEDVMM